MPLLAPSEQRCMRLARLHEQPEHRRDRAGGRPAAARRALMTNGRKVSRAPARAGSAASRSRAASSGPASSSSVKWKWGTAPAAAMLRAITRA